MKARRNEDTGAEAHKFTIRRTFDAPRALVWQTWTDPDHLRKWSCPKDFTVTFVEGSLAPGGKWRTGMRAPDGAIHIAGGEYREIAKPTRLVFTHAWEDDQGVPGPDTLIEITLDEAEGRTTMTFEQTGFASLESRNGHESGWREAFDNLADYLTEAPLRIVVTRRFDAPAERVFDAWLDPNSAGRWLFATEGGTMQKAEIDPRVGGSWRFVEKRGDEVADHWGTYQEIERPRRLAFSFTASMEPLPTRVVVDIKPLEDGCELTLTHEIHPKWAPYVPQARSGWLGILEGLANTLD